MFTESDLIHAYTRSQAISDGVLVDVTETAGEAGFAYPVALTAGAFAACVTAPAGVSSQDEAGRLWDVLWMLRTAIRRAGPGLPEIRYRLHVRCDDRAGEPPLVELKAVCGPDDAGRPCITVMLPDED